MPVYFYWGEDDFRLHRAITALRDRVLDAAWASFNYEKIAPEQPDAVMQALNQSMTLPFGAGSRLVWLADTSILQRCPEAILIELERTLPTLPATTVLLMSSRNKPDGRLKATKLLQKHGEIREFSPIPPWKTEQIRQQVQQAAQEVGVKLTLDASQLLADSVGNKTRQLFSELEKLKLNQGNNSQPIGVEIVSSLVVANTQNSLQLATAIRQGQTAQALNLVTDLHNRNEPALRIVATLVGQFRTWLWVKLMVDSGEKDERAIARAAEVNNPKRVYFLKQEVRRLSLAQLQQTLPLLMELEYSLKQGANEIATLQTKVIELCHLCR
ncbi:MAG: DNA polymerase III subunit delta [Cyanothece sp. SIO1E1]|nr:DNA polymerase III subunit delta [Cyanothece sp. SIO1E1]